VQLLSEDDLMDLYNKASEKYAEGAHALPKKDEAEKAPQAKTIPSPRVEREEVSETDPTKMKPADLAYPERIESSVDVRVTSGALDEGIESIRPGDEKLLHGYKPLAELRVAVDVENETLGDIITGIIQHAETKTGPWRVKWRLQDINEHILREKVNLTAESTFNQFMEYVVERVNNMTGVKLFVTVFDKSRIIIISDTYY